MKKQSKKFLGFEAALARLCKEYGVYIETSGYDYILVWDADDKNPPGILPEVSDCTEIEK